MEEFYYAAIIGGGASGLIAASVCGSELIKNNRKEKIVILEKEFKIGKKLLATGNGKCNLTNINAVSENYYGDKEFAENALNQYSPFDIINYFIDCGVLIKENTQGRMYPYTNQATTIYDAIKRKISKNNIDTLCEYKVIDIIQDKGFFRINTTKGEIKAKKVLFATGGKNPKSIGDLYDIIKKLGHTITPLFPGLCPIPVNSPYINSLKGIRHCGTVTLKADNNIIKSESGEIQFNEDNLSGICIFNISRLVNEYITYKSINNVFYNNISISLDLVADYSFRELTDILYNIQKTTNIKGPELIEGIVHRKLAQAIYKQTFNSNDYLKTLNDHEIKMLANTMKNFVFNVKGTYNWKNNQITCGGVSKESVNPVTLQSKQNKNIYFCGEILNVDGDCGGFNLQFAFSSGIIAGKELAK